MEKRTALLAAVVVIPLVDMIGLLLLIVVMPKLLATGMDRWKQEGPWGSNAQDLVIGC